MPEILQRLIKSINLLPWIWEKTAMKLAFFLLNSNPWYVENFSNILSELKTWVWKCETCHNLVDKWDKECQICLDKNRDRKKIAVVEEYLDLLTIEQWGVYDGLYHILWWAISPMNWVFVWDLNIEDLFKRLEKEEEQVELILATNPNIEGEATAIFIKEEIEKRWLKSRVKLTRLSRWLSAWYLEYADNITLLSAIKERKEF